MPSVMNMLVVIPPEVLDHTEMIKRELQLHSKFERAGNMPIPQDLADEMSRNHPEYGFLAQFVGRNAYMAVIRAHPHMVEESSRNLATILHISSPVLYSFHEDVFSIGKRIVYKS